MIGNEAVFSRWKPARDGVLGMDILRLALEEAASRDEAARGARAAWSRVTGGSPTWIAVAPIQRSLSPNRLPEERRTREIAAYLLSWRN